jgi:hypothetical protein
MGKTMTVQGLKAGMAAMVCLAALTGCDGEAYTLYRSSVIMPDGRLHIATFDAADGDRYNDENCRAAQTLFQAQPDVKVRYWCEKGRFKK